MPTITLRLDDATKDELDALARGRGESLSDLIRSALNTFLLRDTDQGRPDVTPPSLTAVERQQLALLHRILARVIGPEENLSDGDREYQLKRAEVLEMGFVGEYATEFGMLYPELSTRDSQFVIRVLNLFRITALSLDRLKENGQTIDDSMAYALTFAGFDCNDDRESHLLDYAKSLVGPKRWPELHKQFSIENDFGNSHSLMANTYQRMTDEYERIKADKGGDQSSPDWWFLTVDELQRLIDARTHPTHRPATTAQPSQSPNRVPRIRSRDW